MRRRSAASPLPLLLATALVAGCGGQSLASALPKRSTFPKARYSQSAVEKCLLAGRALGVGALGVHDARLALGNGRASSVPPGITGQLNVAGAAQGVGTPLGKAFKAAGWLKPRPGVKLGQPMNGATLVFFRTGTLARHGAERLAEVYLFRENLSDEQKSWFAELYGQPPPLSALRRVVALTGNVVVIWDYPLVHVALSNRILDRCLANSKL